MCVVHLYVRTFSMRRACEIVRCTLMWREMQTCIHEVCMDRHVQRYVHSKSQPSFFFSIAPEQLGFFPISFGV